MALVEEVFVLLELVFIVIVLPGRSLATVLGCVLVEILGLCVVAGRHQRSFLLVVVLSKELEFSL